MWVFLLVVSAAGCHAVPPTENGLLTKVLQSVEKALDFFAEDYSAINVDGLFGLRLGQGQLRSAVSDCEERTCDGHLHRKLNALHDRLNQTSDAALPYVEAADSDYFDRFSQTIDQPYNMPYKGRTFDTLDESDVGSNHQYNEERGDACYARLMGTYIENDQYLPKCNLTRSCWDYMTQPKTKAYFITHQLLYFIFVEHIGCRKEVEGFIKDGDVDAVQHLMCKKIYQESKQLAQYGDVIATKKDLFLEQTLLCGTLGFEDFFRQDWISMVLSWPDSQLGCFKYKPVSIDWLNKVASSDYKTSNKRTMRDILREKPMKDGCLSHTSGLGFGVLCTYLRYLIRFLYSPYMLQ